MTIGLNMKSPGNSGAFFRIRARAAAEPAGFVAWTRFLSAVWTGCLDRFGLLPALSGLCFRHCISRRRGGAFPALYSRYCVSGR